MKTEILIVDKYDDDLLEDFIGCCVQYVEFENSLLVNCDDTLIEDFIHEYKNYPIRVVKSLKVLT